MRQTFLKEGLSNNFKPIQADAGLFTYVAGGAGIVVGLATYGYKIMQVFGVKSVKLTNSRGFCVELSTAAIVILSSRYG